MRKIFAWTLAVLLIVIGAASLIRTENPPAQMAVDNTSSLVIGEGEVCAPYVPQGTVEYDASWTGVYPEIEAYEKPYSTATFALG